MLFKSLSHAGSAQKKAWSISTQDLFLHNSIQSPFNSVDEPQPTIVY
ncbi:hypothetical protein LB503_002442 [Fusarium chuoi]|nr:hypothetical protein LB503_002442 [Fusarium chuoi]